MGTVFVSLLIVINGGFVAAEFAIIGVSKAAIAQAARNGRRFARIVQAVLHDPREQDRYIATAQVGITLSSLGLGMYGEHSLVRALVGPLESLGVQGLDSAHFLARLTAVLGLTYVHIVLAELVPKAVALQHPMSTALIFAAPMRALIRLNSIFVQALNAAGNAILRLFGVRRRRVNAPHSREVLRFMVGESVLSGALNSQAGELVEELFQFSILTAGAVMRSRIHVVGLPTAASLADIRRIVASHPHARYPVYESTLDNISGVCLMRDLLHRLLEGAPLQREDVRPVPFVPATARLEVVLAQMRQHKTQMAVVMDEQGGTAGILTTADLFRDVVGASSNDPVAAPVVYDEAGELRALGIARIDQVGMQLGLELNHPEVDSVSGLVLALLDRPPQVGDTLSWSGIELRVRSVTGRGVQECAIRRLRDSDTGAE